MTSPGSGEVDTPGVRANVQNNFRDELAMILHYEGAYCGACDFESGGCPDCTRILGKYADAILAAGVRPRARVIETVEELDALPVGAIVRENEVYSNAVAFSKVRLGRDGLEWAVFDLHRRFLSREIILPATVLFEGES